MVVEEKRRLKNQITGSLKLYIYCSLLKIRVLYYPRNILIARKKCLHRKVKKWQLNLKEEQIYSSINSNYNHKKTIKQFFKMYNMLRLWEYGDFNHYRRDNGNKFTRLTSITNVSVTKISKWYFHVRQLKCHFIHWQH